MALTPGRWAGRPACLASPRVARVGGARSLSELALRARFPLPSSRGGDVPPAPLQRASDRRRDVRSGEGAFAVQ